MRKWTKDEIGFLSENYDKLSFDELVNAVNHPKSSIIDKASQLRLSKGYYWSLEDEQFLKDNYACLQTKDIAIALHKTVKSILLKAMKTGLKKPKNFQYMIEFKDYSGSGRYWTDDDITYLTQNFRHSTYAELSRALNRSELSITNKAYKLKLKRDESFQRNATIKRNKSMGRDLNYDVLKAIALKYKTRGEFQNKDHSAYSTARTAGVLNDICSHMLTTCNYSTPQLILHQMIKGLIDSDCLYNTRKIISPYEIDVYSEKFKLGFEYNGRGWHGKDKETFKRDQIKVELCQNNDITLIVIPERNRHYEEDIKEQLIEHLTLINNTTHLTLQPKDIVEFKINYSILLMDKRDIKTICMSYDNYELFRQEQEPIYQKIRKNMLLREYTEHMKRKMNVFWDEDSLKKEIAKYEMLGDFYTKSFAAYCYCKKHKLDHLYSHLKRKSRYGIK